MTSAPATATASAEPNVDAFEHLMNVFRSVNGADYPPARSALIAEYRRVEQEHAHYRSGFTHASLCVEALQKQVQALQKEAGELREVLDNVQHGVGCPAQPGWLDAGPCTCGLDAALATGSAGETQPASRVSTPEVGHE